MPRVWGEEQLHLEVRQVATEVGVHPLGEALFPQLVLRDPLEEDAFLLGQAWR